MTLESLCEFGRLRHHQTSKQEISELFGVMERDIKDAALEGLSPDGRFNAAYSAIFQAETALLYCNGFRAIGLGHHASTFSALRNILSSEDKELIDYFDSCRGKRNITEYKRAGIISKKEADDLLGEAGRFTKKTKETIRKNHPQYV